MREMVVRGVSLMGLGSMIDGNISIANKFSTEMTRSRFR